MSPNDGPKCSTSCRTLPYDGWSANFGLVPSRWSRQIKLDISGGLLERYRWQLMCWHKETAKKHPYFSCYVINIYMSSQSIFTSKDRPQYSKRKEEQINIHRIKLAHWYLGSVNKVNQERNSLLLVMTH